MGKLKSYLLSQSFVFNRLSLSISSCRSRYEADQAVISLILDKLVCWYHETTKEEGKTVPTSRVSLSQLIRYTRVCGSHQDFLDRELLLIRKLLNRRDRNCLPFRNTGVYHRFLVRSVLFIFFVFCDVLFAFKDRATRTPLKTGDEIRFYGRVSSFRSTSGTRCVTLIAKPLISH
jgi:hypothetical protein